MLFGVTRIGRTNRIGHTPPIPGGVFHACYNAAMTGESVALILVGIFTFAAGGILCAAFGHNLFAGAWSRCGHDVHCLRRDADVSEVPVAVFPFTFFKRHHYPKSNPLAANAVIRVELRGRPRIELLASGRRVPCSGCPRTVRPPSPIKPRSRRGQAKTSTAPPRPVRRRPPESLAPAARGRG